MKNKDQYWDDLVSDIYNKPENESVKKSSHSGKWNEDDRRWAFQLKDQLSRIFLWDQYNKKEAKLRLDYRITNKENRLIKLSRANWFKAAVLLLALLSGALIHLFMQESLQPKRFVELDVPLGQMSQIKLLDGTEVWLNSGSVLKYSNQFGKKKREVYLDGEAYFEVSKDKRKPFLVNGNDFKVEVLGTSFNVSTYSKDKHSTVTLIEGSVRLHSDENNWTENIVPGQIATLSNGDLHGIEEVNTEFLTSWKEGKIVFRKESLENIAKKMERWYNVDIQFENEQLKNLEFSGTFLKNKPVEQVFRSLSIMSKKMDFVSINRVDQKNIIKLFEKN